jgi:hypothetical protein
MLQIAGQLVGVVAQQDGADTSLALGDQDGAQDAFAGGVADLLTGFIDLRIDSLLRGGAEFGIPGCGVHLRSFRRVKWSR